MDTFTRAMTVPHPPGDDDVLVPFWDTVLSSLPRRDQRRWAEVYLKGLLSVPGRKSVSRIAEGVLGRPAEQCLQQFVNQSPWAWDGVRARTAEIATPAIAPRAWVVHEVAFPKNGRQSVGVAPQYAPTARRMLNCQLGMAVSLVGAGGCCPVDWRLTLPRCWDDDQVRRRKAHLPAAERSRHRWLYLADMLNEMIDGWGMRPLPVVVDSRHDTAVEPLIATLERRGVPYVARIPECRTPNRTVGRRRPPNPRPDGTWISNLGVARGRDVAHLVELADRAGAEVARLDDGLGLQHFEGRSFRGWHHHVTLVSVAQASRLLGRRVDLPPQAYAPAEMSA